MPESSLIDSLDDIFFAFDESGTAVEWNQAAVDITGYSEEELSEMTPADFFEEDTDRVMEAVSEVFETGEATLEANLVTADGDRIPYEFKARRLPEDTPAAFAGIGRDISERVQRRNELRKQNEKLERFASVVSHDLRNPLNVVSGSIELAEETGDLEQLTRAKHAIERMNTLIDDLLTLARTGEVIDDIELVDLGNFARECWKNVLTEDADLEVETEMVIRADKNRLQQLLENLFRNAVEHGGDAVTVSIGELPDGFYIEDDGVGIPKEDREFVFEGGYSTISEGTGFGLSIAAEVVEGHGWEICVTDSSEGGARFEITNVVESAKTTEV
jgi:PAS domain S-box-containing protein